ncbi:MAG: hypothetical protein PHI12_14920 [Dehalococcoidales bacterium]|nr:hypothetical protein [Dehalococcoidales bacterium]
MALSDWDIWKPNTTLTLDATWYKSSPTSVKLASTGTTGRGGLISRRANVQLVPEGEIRFWVKKVINSQPAFSFRNQSPLGSGQCENCYLLKGYATTWQLSRVVNGSPTVIGTMGTCPSNGEEGHYRCVFWNGENLSGVAALAVSLYQENTASEWVLQGTLYDTVNMWRDSTINRMGIGFSGGSGNSLQFDDTELWTPTA